MFWPPACPSLFTLVSTWNTPFGPHDEHFQHSVTSLNDLSPPIEKCIVRGYPYSRDGDAEEGGGAILKCGVMLLKISVELSF